MQKNNQNDTPVPGHLLKKVVVGTITVIVVVVVAVGFLWADQAQRSVKLQGVVTNINMEDRSFVLEQGKLIQQEDGSVTRESSSKTILWHRGTQFIPNQNRALQNLASVKVTAPYGADKATQTTARKIEAVSPPPEIAQ